MLTRRKFLQRSAHVALLTTFGASCAPRAFSPEQFTYQIHDWTGDTFTPMHRLRDGWVPKIPPPSRHVDVAIVGSGIAGLTAAYQLRNRSVVILEREDESGGNAKSAEYRGVQYAQGAAYFVDVEEPYGKLYSDLGLELKPLSTNTDLIWQGQGFTPFEQSTLASDFERLKHFFTGLLESEHFPLIPIAEASHEALKLDRISLLEFLKADYSPEILKLIDTYCYSALGASIGETSAYAGLNFYSEIASAIYALPGGNGFIAKRLADRVKSSGAVMETGCSVINVEERGDNVWISYIQTMSGDTLDPEVTTISAKRAILSVPYFFLPRIFKGLRPNEIATMRSLKYGSYLVANLCFDRVVLRDGYDHWVPGSESITDFIDAEYVTAPRGKTGERAPFVFTVYAPYRNPLLGRVELFVGNRELLSQRIVSEVNRFVPFSPQALREVHLTRFGHQVTRCAPGQIATLRAQRKRLGRVLLAHSDGQGMPAIESAISEGLWAARELERRVG